MKPRIVCLILLVSIILLAAALRIHTFYLPHNHGDQVYYLGLAMKLDNYGFSEYNLKGIDGATVSKDGSIVAVIPSKDKEKGSILEGLEQANVFYYSKEKLSNMPPGFSFMLMLSHKIFNSNELYTLVNSNLGPNAIKYRPSIFFRAQFYSAWINFVFSLLFILAVFFLGKVLFSANIGLWASLLVAVAPVDILTSQRLWTDEMAALFAALTALLFFLGTRQNKTWLIALSGLCAGIASISKSSGLFIIAVMILSSIITKFISLYKQRINPKAFFDRNIFIFLACSLLVCSFWYIRVALVYGVPWYMPKQEGIEKVAPWFIMLAERPRYGQLLYFVYLSPVFIFFYWEAFVTIIKRLFSEERIMLLIWFIVYVLILIKIAAKEERYMLPAYPAISILTAVAIENIREKLNRLSGIKYLGTIVVLLALTVASIYSSKLGLDCVFNNKAIFDFNE